MFVKITTAIKTKYAAIKAASFVKHTLGRTFKGAHLFYFGAVAVEAHGTYALAAGVLLVLFIVNIVLGMGEEV